MTWTRQCGNHAKSESGASALAPCVFYSLHVCCPVKGEAGVVVVRGRENVIFIVFA
jgi:hypothetical protein